MRLTRFVRVLFLSHLVCLVLTNPLNPPEPQPGKPRHDLHPRIYEEFLNDRWHIHMETMDQFYPPIFAFWGFKHFLYGLATRMTADFSTTPPSPHYSFTMGSLVLHAESVTNQPIAWETMRWLIRRLAIWADNDWPGGEFNIWLTDDLLDNAVFVSLRALLDSP